MTTEYNQGFMDGVIVSIVALIIAVSIFFILIKWNT